MFYRHFLTVKTIAFILAIELTAPLAHSQSNGTPAQLAQIQAKLTQLQSTLAQVLANVTPPTPVAQNKTVLLFPFVTNTSGFDTGIAISNTGVDNTGTIGINGTATIYFFGDGAPANPVNTGQISAGKTYTNLASTIAPGFQGYAVVVCNFPFAHGFGLLSDLGARNLAATIPALVLPFQRANTMLEQLGQ